MERLWAGWRIPLGIHLLQVVIVALVSDDLVDRIADFEVLEHGTEANENVRCGKSRLSLGENSPIAPNLGGKLISESLTLLLCELREARMTSDHCPSAHRWQFAFCDRKLRAEVE